MFFNQYPYLNMNDLNLDWIIAHFKEFVDEIASLDSWRSQHEQEYLELKSFMDDLANGELPPAMYESLRDWINKNLFSLVGEMVKFITVGINDDGYIYFQFPEQWSVLKFNTTQLDITTPLEREYGHLTISY